MTSVCVRPCFSIIVGTKCPHLEEKQEYFYSCGDVGHMLQGQGGISAACDDCDYDHGVNLELY